MNLVIQKCRTYNKSFVWSLNSEPYLSRLRRDSVGADFQSVRKLTNYICAAPPESRLRHFSNVYYALQQHLRLSPYSRLNCLTITA